MRKLLHLSVVAMGVLAFPIHLPAYAADTITLKIGYSPGGNYDALGRLASRFIGKYLPGEPSIVVQNVPGAGSLVLAKRMLETEPSDGSVLGMINPGVALLPIFEPEQIDFDPRSIEWIGSLASSVFYCYTLKGSGVETLDDFRNKTFLVGATSLSGGSYRMAAVTKNVLGAKFNIVTGFPGSAEARAAVERGEIHSYCALTKEQAMASENMENINFLLQFSEKETELAPSYLDFANSDLDRNAAKLVLGTLSYTHPFMLPPDTPDSVVVSFREAFTKMVSQPEFIDAAKKMGISIEPSSSDDIEAYLSDAFDADENVVKLAREMVQ